MNWMRRKVPPTARASARASVVLPTPGTSSMSRWPRAASAATARRTTSGLPWMTLGDGGFEAGERGAGVAGRANRWDW